MAMMTWMQSVSSDELAALVEDPTTINRLDQPEEQFTTVELPQTLAYLLCGNAWPDADDGPLGVALLGQDSVPTSTLENGVFHVVPVGMSGEVAAALHAVDLDTLRDTIASTDFEPLVEDEELFEIEDWLWDTDGLTDALISAVERLRRFYDYAAAHSLGVVMYVA